MHSAADRTLWKKELVVEKPQQSVNRLEHDFRAVKFKERRRDRKGINYFPHCLFKSSKITFFSII